MKSTLITLLSAAFICLSISTAAAFTRPHRTIRAQQEQQEQRKYKIYCVDGRVEIETMTREEIHKERKVEVCQLTRAEFENMSDAREAARRFGGVGAPCECSPGPSASRR